MPGSGNYALQPVFVEDLAALAVSEAKHNTNTEIDAVGPELFSYKYLTRVVRNATGTRCLILPGPKWLAYAAGSILAMLLGDILITKDDIKGLERNLLVSSSATPATCPTRLSQWLKDNGPQLGRKYASETTRHYR